MTALRVEGLGKRYSRGLQRAGYATLRDALVAAVRAPWRRVRGHPEGDSGLFWALQAVSFEVSPGEVLGVIGSNGAGKSTLLKILSRITPPTTGVVELRGRVGSLLEVGTGFHPELTGRENVYLNGAILGMRKTEIAAKFDAIVAFAELDPFLDTAVKYYSSGMYVRLAFAVAAHLEPEILVVDEVLAVGDLAFQHKCLQHLRSLTRSGMTILLVSHNLAAIQSACTRALLLEKGRLVGSGSPADVVDAYRQSLAHPVEEQESFEGQTVRIVDFQMYGEDGVARRTFRFDEAVRVQIDLLVPDGLEDPMVNFGVRRGDGVIVCNFNNWYDGIRLGRLEGQCRLEAWLPPLRLVPDYYEAHVLVWPWGGGHTEGGFAGSRPLAARAFGAFYTAGPPFNAHDGVFQFPARKWRLTRGEAGPVSEWLGATTPPPASRPEVS